MVYAIRCAISTNLHHFQNDVRVKVNKHFEPEVRIKDLSTRFESPVMDGTLTFAKCKTEQPLEDAAAKVTDVPCLNQEVLTVKHADTRMDGIGVVNVQTASKVEKTHELPLEIACRKIQAGVQDFHTAVRTNVKKMIDEGMRFRVKTMRQLPMRKMIRYRAESLKKIQAKTNEIDFIGVCELIPPTPLRLKRIIKKDHFHFAVGEVRGIPNLYLGTQAWVLYRKKKASEIDTVMVRMEE